MRSESPPAPKWRTWQVKLAYAIFGVLTFLAVLFATFPYTATLSKVLSPMGFEFSSAGQSIRFPFGAELTQVRVSSITSAARNPVIECPVMTIAPSLLSLLTLQPGVRVKASLYDGTARATIRPSGGGTAISYDLDAVNIAQQRLFAIPLPDSTASGTMSGHGDLWFSPTDLATASGNGEMNGAGLAITSDFINAPIRFGTAQAKFKLDGGVLTIEELKTTGGDLTLSATGTIQLAPDPSESTVAIQFTLVPAAAAASRLSLLFALLPRHRGNEPYQLTGPLSAPQISERQSVPAPSLLASSLVSSRPESLFFVSSRPESAEWRACPEPAEVPPLFSVPPSFKGKGVRGLGSETRKRSHQSDRVTLA